MMEAQWCGFDFGFDLGGSNLGGSDLVPIWF